MRGAHVKFHCGDRVYDPVDPRHVGRVIAIGTSVLVRVEWENGLISEVNASNFQKGSQ
jgi:hypothetical protein